MVQSVYERPSVQGYSGCQPARVYGVHARMRIAMDRGACMHMHISTTQLIYTSCDIHHYIYTWCMRDAAEVPQRSRGYLTPNPSLYQYVYQRVQTL